jgi:hypothetical protein
LFEIRRVTNVLHKVTKIPLLLFFVDLEPSIKSAEIFYLSSLLHTKIKVEEPYKTKTITNVQTVRNMVTQKPTADTPHAVSAVAQITSPLTVQINSRMHQSALSAQAIILQVIKAVPFTRISSVPKINHTPKVTFYQLTLDLIPHLLEIVIQ